MIRLEDSKAVILFFSSPDKILSRCIFVHCHGAAASERPNGEAGLVGLNGLVGLAGLAGWASPLLCGV